MVFAGSVRQFGEGGNYQELLDEMVANGAGDACWLLEKFGPTEDVRSVDTLTTEAVVFAWYEDCEKKI